MRFRIVEIKQKVQEKGLAKTGKLDAATGFINSLAAIGSAFGMKTQALYSATAMVGNVKNLIADFKKFFDIRKKSHGLGSNELKLVSIIKDKKLYKNIEKYVESAMVLTKNPPPPAAPSTQPTTSTTAAPITTTSTPTPVTSPTATPPIKKKKSPKKIPSANKKTSTRELDKLISDLTRAGVRKPEKYAKQIMAKKRGKK